MRADELPRAKFALPPEFAKGATAAPDELAENPRARSARLRVLERIEA
jgi:16S rRNA C1402 N4-methylase RsmH